MGQVTWNKTDDDDGDSVIESGVTDHDVDT